MRVKYKCIRFGNYKRKWEMWRVIQEWVSALGQAFAYLEKAVWISPMGKMGYAYKPASCSSTQQECPLCAKHHSELCGEDNAHRGINSRLLWSISVILWEFLGARIGSGILAKRPPQVRNDDGNENEELRVALRYVWWRQEWQDLLVGYKGMGVGCEIQDQSDISN